jgi:hypothetical protein
LIVDFTLFIKQDIKNWQLQNLLSMTVDFTLLAIVEAIKITEEIKLKQDSKYKQIKPKNEEQKN